MWIGEKNFYNVFFSPTLLSGWCVLAMFYDSRNVILLYTTTERTRKSESCVCQIKVCKEINVDRIFYRCRHMVAHIKKQLQAYDEMYQLFVWKVCHVTPSTAVNHCTLLNPQANKVCSIANFFKYLLRVFLKETQLLSSLRFFALQPWSKE